MVRTVATDMRFWENQEDVVLNQANPVSGTQYVVLPETTYVWIYGSEAEVTWTIAVTNLQLHYTLDGIVITHTVAAPVSGAPHSIYKTVGSQALAPAGQPLVAAYGNTTQRVVYKSKVCSITAECTGGTANPLEARIKYMRYI